MKRGQLGLSIRETGAPRQTAVALNAKAIASWIDTLPVANIGETARQVYQFLVDCNSQAIDPTERLKIMQAMMKITQHIGDALRKHYIGQSVSLNEKQRKVAALAQAMQSEMAIGFKTIIEDALTSQKLNPQLLTPATHGAIHYLSLVLLRCYQLYSQQPAQLWRELHILFLFAEQNGFSDASSPLNPNESVRQAYIRIILVTCSNPYQLRQREIEQLYEVLIEICDRVYIGTFSRDHGLYFIDLQSDQGPQNAALAQVSGGNQWRTLQCEQVVEVLQDELRSSSQLQLGTQRSNLQQLGAPLLRHLVRSFGNLTTRAFSRTPAAGTLKLSIGLSATHFLLSGGGGQNVSASLNIADHDLATLEGSLRNATLVEDDRRANRNLGGVKPEPTTGGDPWEKLYRPKQSWEREHPKTVEVSVVAPNNFTANADVRYEFQIAALVNISPGGYCLALRGNVPAQTQTGEIVGMMEQDSDGTPHWNIGTIRWMKRVPDAALQIGLQLIAPNARPVMTQIRNSQMASAAFQRSLLLPALKGIGQPATLITASMPYAVNQKIRLKDNDNLQDVRLSKQVASSASFKQFQFDEAAGSSDEVAVVKRGGNDTPDNFDAVWELL
jgi:hypothetical protein